MNDQLKDLLKTYNLETKKLRDDFEHREQEMKAKVAELSRTLILQEKKLIERMIEGLDSKHQMYNADRFEFDVLGKMDQEFDDMKHKRKQLETDFAKKAQAGLASLPKPVSQSANNPAPVPAAVQPRENPQPQPAPPAQQPPAPPKKEEPARPDARKAEKPEQPMFPSFGKEKPKPAPPKPTEDFEDGSIR
jgi:hypothetical protein